MTAPDPRAPDPLARLARWGLAFGVAGYTLLILRLTLSPGEADPDYWLSGCLICGAVGTADAVKNVAFFVPFGFLLALALRGRWWAAVPAAGLSVAVETLQYVVPGRDASPADLVFNTLGALLGVALARWGSIWAAPVGRATVLSRVWTVAVVAGLAGYGMLQERSVPAVPASQQWTPAPDETPPYGGRVLEAWIGPHAFLDEDREPGKALAPDVLASALERADPMRVRLIVGPHRPEEAAILRAQNRARGRLFQVGVRGWDLTVGVRGRLSDARVFEQDQVIPAALAGLQAGDTVELLVERRGDRVCATVSGRAVGCGSAPTPGALWRAFEPRADRIVPRRALNALTILALALPLGWWSARWTRRLALGAAVAGALVLVPATTGLSMPEALEWLALPLGLGLGVLLRAGILWVRSHRTPSCDSATHDRQLLGGHGS